METTKHIPVGIYNKEIFIAEIEGDKIRHFDVLRYVSEKRLAELRDPDEMKDYYKDLWIEAVKSGRYEGGLSEYVEEVFDEADLDSDEEMYPGKDESDCEYLTEDIRKEADDFIEEQENDVVGTWESSGCYSPATQWHKNDKEFRNFDYVFNTPEAKKIAKEFVESL